MSATVYLVEKVMNMNANMKFEKHVLLKADGAFDRKKYSWVSNRREEWSRKGDKTIWKQ